MCRKEAWGRNCGEVNLFTCLRRFVKNVEYEYAEMFIEIGTDKTFLYAR